MSSRLSTRLCRAEALLLQVRPFPALLVAPVGLPVDEPAYGLVILVHRSWCDDPTHTGACAPPLAVEESMS